ncbi:MAG: hypothetical protein COA33_014270 [Fluviicola sp.]|nr:hypothetical protein [Fluviicola sp.]
MPKFFLTIILSFALVFVASSQDTTLIFSTFNDDSDYKVVMKTQNFNGSEDIALDNLTIKKKGDETKVYYIRYGDMLISSLTIPYSIIERFIKFEKHVRSVECKTNDCKDSVLFIYGEKRIVIPIDILYEELLSNLMLELESMP